ncbi:NYN domain-containing protein, partial [Collinsella stercoris]
MFESTSELRFAVLIDADNISEKYVKVVLDEISNAGVATYKRIYGDWTSPRLASWKSCLLDNSIIPMQQYSYTYGKNATDSAMIIDAMDILYSGTVDGFAIVSSDSDFTRLVARLRESGMVVIGMGEQKTPKPFISACNQFKYLDLLYAQQVEAPEEPASAAADDGDEQAGRSSQR